MPAAPDRNHNPLRSHPKRSPFSAHEVRRSSYVFLRKQEREDIKSCPNTQALYVHMRSYFNKPSWASRTDEDEDPEFYRRAGQVYKDIVATTIGAHERRATSLQKNAHKRRCLSNSTHDEDTRRLKSEQEAAAEPRLLAESSPLSQTVPDPSTVIIGLANSSRAHQVSISNETPTMNTKDIPQMSQDSPQSKIQDMCANFTPSLPIATNDGKADVHTKDRLDGTRAPAKQGTSSCDRDAAYDDTVVHILIDSKIANTKPLIIQRRMSQSLKGVRLAWCARQNLPKELQTTVFLTWKGRRLFDVTTCRSLNISTFTKEISRFDEFFSDSDAPRVIMEAVTEEIYAARHRSSPNVVAVGPTSSRPTECEDAKQYAKTEIILKCPGHDDFKTRVPLTANISEIIGAFREARSISPELAVYLAFDGDRLDSQSSLEENEITDGDLIDVLIKQEVCSSEI
ncbi:ubiquitin-2 like Rad60 SUMO-like-domain-containing protein [Aspergillus desertorum]